MLIATTTTININALRTFKVLKTKEEEYSF